MERSGELAEAHAPGLRQKRHLRPKLKVPRCPREQQTKQQAAATTTITVPLSPLPTNRRKKEVSCGTKTKGKPKEQALAKSAAAKETSMLEEEANHKPRSTKQRQKHGTVAPVCLCVRAYMGSCRTGDGSPALGAAPEVPVANRMRGKEDRQRAQGFGFRV